MTNDAGDFALVRGPREGGHLRIIAPSSPFDREAFERGVTHLRTRYVVSYDERIFERDGFLAGDDARRLHELHDALRDESVDAIACARGGYGAMRLLDRIDVDLVRSARKLLVGFSDVTALHVIWQRAGLRSLHASMVAALGKMQGERVVRWMSGVEGATPPPMPVKAIRPGVVTAPLVGGNLAVLAALVGTPHALPVAGRALLIEDIGEAPYRVDRMLTTLRLAGVLEAVAAVVVGDFTSCNAREDGRTVEDVLRDRLGDLRVPVVRGLPIGHAETENLEVALGAPVEIDADRGLVTFLQGAVAPG